MWKKLKELFGIYDLRAESAERCAADLGEATRGEYLKLYDAVNSGTAIHFVEAILVIHYVEEAKRDMRARTLLGRLFPPKKKPGLVDALRREPK